MEWLALDPAFAGTTCSRFPGVGEARVPFVTPCGSV
jgi:hypothetical protein